MEAITSKDLAGRVSVITGGGSGVGASIAESLAAHGSPVVLLARGLARLEAVASRIIRQGGQAMALSVDLTDAAAVEAARGEIQQRLGVPSILINAAGTFGPIAMISQADPALWRQTIEVNLLGPYLTCRTFLPGMLAAGWGRIINLGSAASLHQPGPLTSAYAVSKCALDRLTRHLAVETHGSGVTVNVIHPGEVKTDMWADIRDRANALGPEGAGLRSWAELVGATGGDDPRKAAQLVQRIIADATLTGRFLWIDGGLQQPIPSWDSSPAPAFTASST
jgi:NAD(P)-dependent dehydrogenase (short-subunit alcohol dehydrogenase family)